MAATSVLSLFRTSLDYLLVATVGLLVADAVWGFRSRNAFVLLTGVVAVGFAIRSVARIAGLDERGSPATGDSIDRRVVVAALVVLMAVGLVLRGYGLGVQSLWFDEAITANAAIALLEHGRPTFPSGYTYWRAFPHTLIVAGSMALFGTGEAAARLPSVVFGVLTIPVTYWLGRQVGGRSVGLVAAVLLTFLTWEIAWSRQARMYQQFQLLYTLSLVLLLRVERTWFADRWAVAAMVVVGVLTAETHDIGYVLLPVTIAYLAFATTVKERIPSAQILTLVVVATTVTLTISFTAFNMLTEIGRSPTVDVYYGGAYVTWLASELGAVFFLGPIGAALLFYLGRYRPGTLLVLAVVPALLVLSHFVELFAPRYLYFGLPVLAVWSSQTVNYAAALTPIRTWLNGHDLPLLHPGFDGSGTDSYGERRALARLVAVLLLVTVLTAGGGFVIVPETEYTLGPNAPQPDFKSAYEYVNNNRQPDDVIVAGWTAPGLYYAGEVDFWLSHRLTGREEQWTIDGRDIYAGAEPVRSVDELHAVIQGYERGWIVIDHVALSRQDRAERQRILRTQCRSLGDIYVCQWGHEE